MTAIEKDYDFSRLDQLIEKPLYICRHVKGGLLPADRVEIELAIVDVCLHCLLSYRATGRLMVNIGDGNFEKVAQ